MANISINGVNYNTYDMTDEAKEQVQSLQFTTAEINRLNLSLAAMQTAQQAYGNALHRILNESSESEDEDNAEIDLPDNLNFD